MIPIEASGLKVEKLDYEKEGLNDQDVRALVDALCLNNTFQGPLDLSKNELTDLVSYQNFLYSFLQSALYLKDAIGRPGAKNLTKLKLSKIQTLKMKAGIFIGDALIDNKDHPIEKICFKDVTLGEDGLLRILEACNSNQNIKKINLGYISDRGLKLVADTFLHNRSLNKLKFQEEEENPWSEQSKDAFLKLLKVNKWLTKVKFEPANKKDPVHEGHKLFKKEIEFFIKKIKKEQKKDEKMEERMESCADDHLFDHLLKLIEDKDEHEKMPVRKFFNNTFGTLLNDAIFDLMKKRQKSKS